MADFEDITGWREELAAFEKTEEGWAYLHRYGPVGGPKVPFKNAVELADLILRHDEIHEALKKTVAWSDYTDAHPELTPDDDEFWELNPEDAHMTLATFEKWYAMKTRLPINVRRLVAGVRLAIDVETGEISSLNSSAPEAYARQNYSHLVSFGEASS